MDKSLQVMAMYYLTHIGLIFFMYPTDIIESLTVGHWSAILLGFAAHVVLLGIYMKGLSYSSPLNVIDILLGAGKGFAVILLLPVAAYLLAVIIISIRAYSEIIALVFLGSTPVWAIIALLLGVTTLISALGVEAIFRTALLTAALLLPFLLLVFCVSFQNADWRYVLPLMDSKAASFSYVFSRPYLKSLFAFAGGFLFLGFIPHIIPYKHRKVMWTSALLLPMFLISVYVPILTFGQRSASQFVFPFITTVDTVDIRWLMFDRITMFLMISLICFVVLFLSLAMWKLTLLIRRGFPFFRPLPVTLLLALSLMIICMQIPDWKTVERLLWWNTYLRLFVTIVIPLVTLVLGIRHQREGVVRP
ncbi:GerAB/ArcD/ProY family transporter [Paenibacillus sp. HJGM_3]|uniref:GerAB/ArcD/ProY family transporter n=1 Tax=Paenibacillus sp. HJGM_3 TaxID=3379816 RepID=UPI00385E9D6A